MTELEKQLTQRITGFFGSLGRFLGSLYVLCKGRTESNWNSQRISSRVLLRCRLIIGRRKYTRTYKVNFELSKF